MASLNKVMLIGNLTRDPEVRMMTSGRPVCNFGLAMNRSYKDSEGNRKEEVTFCLLYTSPSPRDVEESRMPSSA